jgi:hypothetical protein
MVRVLKPSGSIFVNLGDKYAERGGPERLGGVDSDDYVSRPAYRPRRLGPPDHGLRAKSLFGLPWAYALGCTGMLAALTRGYVPIDLVEQAFRAGMTDLEVIQALQFLHSIGDLGAGPDPALNLILRAEIVLAKLNGLPESVRDRVRRSHEQVFHFVKQPRYYSAIDEIRESHAQVSLKRAQPHRADPGRSSREGLPYGELAPPQTLRLDQMNHPLGKLPGSVWNLASEPLRLPDWLGVQHYAAFASELPRRLILGWSPPGICLECGQGRVPVVDKRYEVRQQHLSDRQSQNSDNNWDSAKFPFGGASEATILGYACACTPYTDHPGTGEPSGEHGTYANSLQTGAGYPNVGAGWGGKSGLGDRPKVGPWREYYLDSWRPPPTRPALVIDPFSGVGTTIGVARRLGRIGIGIDLSMPYCRAARWRVFDSQSFGKAQARTWVDRQGSLL